MENFVMLTPLDQQLEELAELEAEIAVLKQYLADTAPPPPGLVVFTRALGHGLKAAVPWSIALALTCALGVGLYWVWAQLPVDTFISRFVSGTIGLGGALACIGMAGSVLSLLDTPFSPILRGSAGFFFKATILGAGQALLGVLGLTMAGSLGL